METTKTHLPTDEEIIAAYRLGVEFLDIHTPGGGKEAMDAQILEVGLLLSGFSLWNLMGRTTAVGFSEQEGGIEVYWARQEMGCLVGSIMSWHRQKERRLNIPLESLGIE